MGKTFKSIIIITLSLFAILSFHAFWVNITYPWVEFFVDFWLWVTSILFVSGTYLIFIIRAKADFHIHRLVFAFILFTLISRFFWVSYFDAQQVSDFLRYWEVGNLIVEHGIASQDISVDVYIRRALFYTVPIHYLFGNSLKALELINISLVTITMIIFYEFGRRTFNTKVAALSLLFFFWNPDIWYGVKLANHDISFLPWFAGLLLLIYWLDYYLHKDELVALPVILISCFIGLFIFIIDIQRGFGRPVWFALLFLLFYYIYLEYRKYNVSINISRFINPGLKSWLIKSIIYSLFIFAVPFNFYQASSFVLDSFIRNETGSGLSYNVANVNIAYYSSKDIYGSDRWGERRSWREAYSNLIPGKISMEYSTRKLIHEIISDKPETARHLFRKNAVLSSPIGTLYFSSRAAEDPWVGRTNTSNISMQAALHRLLSALLFFLLFMRLTFYPLFDLKRETLFLIIYSSFFYLFILLLTEVQPRYNVFSVFLVSLLTAQLIIGLKELLASKNFEGMIMGMLKKVGKNG